MRDHFPTHPNDWKRKRLADVAEIIVSNVDKKSENGQPAVLLCNYTDVYYNSIITSRIAFMEATAKPGEIEKFSILRGDVIVTKDSETPEDIAVPALVSDDLPGVLCGYHLAIIRCDSNRLWPAFLNHLLKDHCVRHYFFTLANGVTRFGLTHGSLCNAHLPMPSLTEQKRIATVLNTADQEISLLEGLIEKKRLLLTGAARQLLLGKRRFQEFSDEWVTCKIGDILKNVVRHVAVDNNNTYRLVSMRRRSGGLFDRSNSMGADIGYSKLKTIKVGDFVIARRQVIHGAMAMATKEFDGAYISDAYVTLVPKEKGAMHMPFFDFMSRLKELYYVAFRCSYGVALEKMFFNLSWFLKESLRIPESLKEQQKIASLLDMRQREIQCLESQLLATQRQRQALRQLLLTGKVRVPELSQKG